VSAIAAVQRAIEAVYSGAGLTEAEAFLEHLDDEGYRVTARVRQDGPSLLDEIETST
jgi:hypothetical protein